MSFERNKEKDRAHTREKILNPNRHPYWGGDNWLGHGTRGGKSAVIDDLLLDGATMEELLKTRETAGSIRRHFSHLKIEHDLPYDLSYSKSSGKYRFDRKYLGVPESPPTEFHLPEEIVQPNVLVEGAVRKITVNAYERNPEARQRCIEHWGAICAACGFEFERIYGSFAARFIHVHHLKPLSELGKAYKVDAVTDLRPVCPNCHAVIHLGGGCLSIDDIKQMLRRRSG